MLLVHVLGQKIDLDLCIWNEKSYECYVNIFYKVHGTIAVVFHPVVKSENVYDRSLLLRSISCKRFNSVLLYNAQLLNNIMFVKKLILIYLFEAKNPMNAM